jgi:hypothetical protein
MKKIIMELQMRSIKSLYNFTAKKLQVQPIGNGDPQMNEYGSTFKCLVMALQV